MTEILCKLAEKITGWLSVIVLLSACQPTARDPVDRAVHLWLASGELTSQSIILQCRFNATDTLVDQDITGVIGTGFFEVAQDAAFADTQRTKSLSADSTNDFIIRSKVTGLAPGTRYYYRGVASLSEGSSSVYSPVGQFITLPPPDTLVSITFATATCFNYEKFYGLGRAAAGGVGEEVAEPATGENQKLGFEAFEAVVALAPHFFVANGDVVYYDSPTEKPELRAVNQKQMRAKWHRYFSMPRARKLSRTVPVYYTKDDHDYRFNDADTTEAEHTLPTHTLGIDAFREAVPVVASVQGASPTYRTHRAGKLLQIWLMEGRDYRSPNLMEDGPDKTLWGPDQKAWLKRTLLESDAVFKLLISPTPMIGPDDAYKKDNHTNPGGFQYERDSFFDWLAEHNFTEKGLYFLCGDRHWQYHSIHPDGWEEFSSGAFVNQNARPGRVPGDPKSTDPEARLRVPYVQTGDNVSGGFLVVSVAMDKTTPAISFSFQNTRGEVLHSVVYKSVL